MTNLWSGRFDIAPDAAAFGFGASFRFDRRLFEDDVTGSLSYGRALAKAGVLDADEAGQIEATLTALLEKSRSDPAFVDGPDEDVHSFVERQLVERIGDAGKRLCIPADRATSKVSLDLRALSPPPDSAAAAGGGGRSWTLAVTGGRGGRRADAVVHALSSGAAGEGRPLLPVACRAAPA